jgi:hypothetical protein
LLSYRDAVVRALGRTRSGDVPTRWSQAELGGRHAAQSMPTDPSWAGGSVYADSRELHIDAPPARVYAAISKLGGTTGWHQGKWLWGLRGALDTLAGGVGLRRGRLHPTELTVGDPLDFWRVEAAEPGELVRLRAEMRLPGEAQRAHFHPRGLWGRAYWCGVWPFHHFVFPGLLRGVAQDAAAAT